MKQIALTGRPLKYLSNQNRVIRTKLHITRAFSLTFKFIINKSINYSQVSPKHQSQVRERIRWSTVNEFHTNKSDLESKDCKCNAQFQLE